MTIVVEALDLGGSGPRVMVKDTIDVAGTASRASSRALDHAPIAAHHSDVVMSLLSAGAHLTGKVVLHELAFGTTGINHYAGTAPNPRYPGRIPGGSSSGSAAAVAAGLADFTLGTDTGGSIRIPACCCGVFGLKPTFGRVSRKGVLPLKTTLDCVGPLAASLPMLVRAMTIIDATFAPAQVPQKAKIGVLRVTAEARVQKVVHNALMASGLQLGNTELKYFGAAYDAGMVIINRETFDACGYLLEAGGVGGDVAGRLAAAEQTTTSAVSEAEEIRRHFAAEVDAALSIFDVLALPTMPDFPLRLEEAGDTRAVLGMTSLVRPFNLSGHPAITIPLGSEEGLPVGLQLVGGKGEDEKLLAIAERLVRNIYSLIT